MFWFLVIVGYILVVVLKRGSDEDTKFHRLPDKIYLCMHTTLYMPSLCRVFSVVVYST